jgi:hypothetical protein
MYMAIPTVFFCGLAWVLMCEAACNAFVIIIIVAFTFTFEGSCYISRQNKNK